MTQPLFRRDCRAAAQPAWLLTAIRVTEVWPTSYHETVTSSLAFLAGALHAPLVLHLALLSSACASSASHASSLAEVSASEPERPSLAQKHSTRTPTTPPGRRSPLRPMTLKYGFNGYATEDGGTVPSEFTALFGLFAHLRQEVGRRANLREVQSLNAGVVAGAISSSGLALEGGYQDRLDHNPVTQDDVKRLVASRRGLVHDVFVYMGYSLAQSNYHAGDIRLIPFDGGAYVSFGQYTVRTRVEDGTNKLDLCEYPAIYEHDL